MSLTIKNHRFSTLLLVHYVDTRVCDNLTVLITAAAGLYCAWLFCLCFYFMLFAEQCDVLHVDAAHHCCTLLLFAPRHCWRLLQCQCVDFVAHHTITVHSVLHAWWTLLLNSNAAQRIHFNWKVSSGPSFVCASTQILMHTGWMHKSATFVRNAYASDLAVSVSARGKTEASSSNKTLSLPWTLTTKCSFCWCTVWLAMC